MSKQAWEIFCDESYYGLWCVREVGNKHFNNPRSFHFDLKSDAEEFKRLVEKAY